MGQVERREALGEFRTERLYSGVELRAEGRRLLGPAIRYGDVSPSHKERFEAGAFDLSADETRWLDVGHDQTRVIAYTNGGGLELRDTPEALEIEATLPQIPLADVALAEVKAGKLKGFSIEFKAITERMESGLRVISSAALEGVGLVAFPSYEQSKVEARANVGKLRGRIPTGETLTCKCHRGSCDQVRFAHGAFDDALKDGGRDTLLISDQFSSAMASRKRGTLRMEQAADGLRIEADLPATTAADDLVKTSAAVNLLARPVFDQEFSEFEEIDGVAIYKRVHLKAILIGASDVTGWPTAKLSGAAKRERRRIWL